MLSPPPVPLRLEEAVRLDHLPVTPPVVVIQPSDTPLPTTFHCPSPATPNQHTLPVQAHANCPGSGCSFFGVLPQRPLEVYVPIAHCVVLHGPWSVERSVFCLRGADGLYDSDAAWNTTFKSDWGRMARLAGFFGELRSCHGGGDSGVKQVRVPVLRQRMLSAI